MSEYAASEMRRQLERGPYEGEDFYRMQVTGEGKTKWVNITPAQLAAIAELLTPTPEPTADEPEQVRLRRWSEKEIAHWRATGEEPVWERLNREHEERVKAAGGRIRPWTEH